MSCVLALLCLLVMGPDLVAAIAAAYVTMREADAKAARARMNSEER